MAKRERKERRRAERELMSTIIYLMLIAIAVGVLLGVALRSLFG